MHTVNWDKICQPKDKGGLGISNVEASNKSLLAKLPWRVFVGMESSLQGYEREVRGLE